MKYIYVVIVDIREGEHATATTVRDGLMDGIWNLRGVAHIDVTDGLPSDARCTGHNGPCDSDCGN